MILDVFVCEESTNIKIMIKVSMAPTHQNPYHHATKPNKSANGQIMINLDDAINWIASSDKVFKLSDVEICQQFDVIIVCDQV